VIRSKKPRALTVLQQDFVTAYLGMPLDKRDIEKAALQAGYSEKTAYACGVC